MPDSMQTALGFGLGSVAIATALSLATGLRQPPSNGNNACPRNIPNTLQRDEVKAMGGQEDSTKKVNTRSNSNPNAVLKCINDRHIKMNEKERREAKEIVNEVMKEALRVKAKATFLQLVPWLFKG